MTTPDKAPQQQPSLLDRLRKNFEPPVEVPRDALGTIKNIMRNGRPGLAWSQEVGSNRTEENVAAGEALRFLGYAVALCGTVGFISNGFEGIAVGAFVACGIWFGIFKGGQEDTERRRRQAVTPIPCQEDCEAFIAEHRGGNCSPPVRRFDSRWGC